MPSCVAIRYFRVQTKETPSLRRLCTVLTAERVPSCLGDGHSPARGTVTVVTCRAFLCHFSQYKDRTFCHIFYVPREYFAIRETLTKDLGETESDLEVVGMQGKLSVNCESHLIFFLVCMLGHADSAVAQGSGQQVLALTRNAVMIFRWQDGSLLGTPLARRVLPAVVLLV